MKLRVVMLVSHPIQYYVPIYREMASKNDIHLTAVFHSRVGLGNSFDVGFGREVTWDIPLLNGYDHEFLSKKNNLKGVELGVINALRRLKPDVIFVHGYHQPTNILAIIFSKLSGIPVLMRSDTRQTEKNTRPGLPKALLKRAIFKMVNGFVAIGSLNQDFYRMNGVPAEKLFFAPFSVSNSFFSLKDPHRSSARSMARQELGIGAEDCVILSASKLISIKRIQDIVYAYANLAAKHSQLRLLIVGTGDQEEALRALTLQLRLVGVVFAGFRNQSELPSIYAAADIFVLASEIESWGLAVNEAMAAGLPCVVSDQVGAAPDLVDGKGTGVVYSCGNVGQMTNALNELISNLAYRQECSQRARELIAEWDTAICAVKFVEACKAVG